MSALALFISLVSNDTSSDPLNLGHSDNLTVTVPLQDNSKLSADTVSASDIVPSTAASDTYVFIKNTDSTNVVTLRTSSASAEFAVLNPGEACFFLSKNGIGVEVIASGAACVVEYGLWTKS